MNRIALTLFAAALTLPLAASARRGGDGPCRADAERLCADDLGNRNAVKACLNANEAELSEACQGRMEKRAARKAARRALKAACATDKARLCGDVEPGGGAVRECMTAHEAELSAECSDAVAEMRSMRGHRGHRGRRGGACKADVQRLCADARGDRGAVRECLQANQDQLSEACQGKMERREARRAAFEAACGQDKATFCADVEPGRGAIRQCMKAHKADLSPACTTFVEEMRGKRGKRGKRGHRGQGQGAF